jgi:hypothetical protein
MGTIIGSRKKGDRVVLEVESDYGEYLQLKGHLNEVYLFSENTVETRTNISQRGKNEATKYFLIPRELRKGFQWNNSVSCQKIDVKDKAIFVYVVNKNRIAPSRREIALKRIEKKYSTMLSEAK